MKGAVNMKSIDRLKDMLCEELDQLSEVESLDEEILETIWKVSDTIKNLGKIKMLENKQSHDGASYFGGDSSYARGRGRNARRDSMGRYSGDMDYSDEGYSEDGYSDNSRSYSRHDAKNHMMHKLGEMMRVASSDEKKILEDAMKKLDRI